MAFVQVEQRNAHLAGAVRLQSVQGRDGPVSKAVLTAISNTKQGSGENRGKESTAIQWTLWGKQAENAAQYLGKGSHVNVTGRVQDNRARRACGVFRRCCSSCLASKVWTMPTDPGRKRVGHRSTEGAKGCE